MEKRRILAFQPLAYTGADAAYWKRDMGLLVKSWRAAGHDAWLVLHPGSARTVPRGAPLLLATPADLAEAKWWQDQGPWGVVFNTWGATRFAPDLAAALRATPRVMERLDTDGNRSPIIDWPLYLHAMWSRIHDMRAKKFRWLRACVAPPLHALSHGLFPSLLDERMAAHIAAFPLVGAESPIAVERMRRFLRSFGRSGENLRLIPHPVDEADVGNCALDAKERVVVSVGRWDSHQKNLPLLLRVLESFLTNRPDWSAVLMGSMPRGWEETMERLCPNAASRISVLGPLPHLEICERMAQSMIFFLTSRHESFGIAAAEALCSGCCLVGPSHIPSVPWFCGSDSGTIATRYSTSGLLDALTTESREWEAGHRNPTQVSKTWILRTGASEVARHILAHLEQL